LVNGCKMFGVFRDLETIFSLWCVPAPKPLPGVVGGSKFADTWSPKTPNFWFFNRAILNWHGLGFSLFGVEVSPEVHFFFWPLLFAKFFFFGAPIMNKFWWLETRVGRVWFPVPLVLFFQDRGAISGFGTLLRVFVRSFLVLPLRSTSKNVPIFPFQRFSGDKPLFFFFSMGFFFSKGTFSGGVDQNFSVSTDTPVKQKKKSPSFLFFNSLRFGLWEF